METTTAIRPEGAKDNTELGFATLISPTGAVEVGQIAAITTSGVSLIIPVHYGKSRPHETVQLDILLIDKDIFLEGIDSIIISKELIHSEQKKFSYYPTIYCYNIKFTELTPHQQRQLTTVTSH